MRPLGKNKRYLSALLIGLAIGGPAHSAEAQTHAERLFSSLDLISPPGPMPSMERTIASLHPVIEKLGALGPIGLLEAGGGKSKLTLHETFADGSEIRRVYADPLAAQKAFAELDPVPADSLKHGSYAYHATVQGSFPSNGHRYGYNVIYGSNEGERWTFLGQSNYMLP